MTPIVVAAGLALFMFGLWIEAHVFTARREDPLACYRLYAVRDKLIRLVAEGKVETRDPAFEALYSNITILLRSSRWLSGPDGWDLAEVQGRALARRQIVASPLIKLPDHCPEALDEVVTELRAALTHLLNNHFGIMVLVDAKRREAARMHKENAKCFLSMMPGERNCPA